MKNLNLQRIKASLQNIEAKRLALVRDIESINEYYDDMYSYALYEEFKNTSLRNCIETLTEIIEMEEELTNE